MALKFKLAHPVPETVRLLMIKVKAFALALGAITYFANHETATLIIGVTVAVLDIATEIFFGENPIVTIQEAAKRLKQEVPDSKVEVICPDSAQNQSF